MKRRENVSTLNDSFFMPFQHIEAAQKSCPLLWYWRVEREGFLQCGGHFGQVEKYINACIIHNIFPTQEMDSSHFINIARNRTGPRRLTLTKSIIDNSRRMSGSVGCFYLRMIIVEEAVVVVAHHGQVQCCFVCSVFGALAKSDFLDSMEALEKAVGVDTIGQILKHARDCAV
jgi:hypothetical protein